MRIALLGTGLLGYAIASRLASRGYSMKVYNRTLSKAQLLKRKGVKVCKTPQEAVFDAHVIILVLADTKAIKKIFSVFSRHSLLGKIVIQMGTIASSESRRIQKSISKLDGEYMECPVLGSRGEAQAGKLILMVGGTRGQYKKCKPLLRALGKNPLYIGEVGQAAALKLALNYLIASHALNFSLSLGLVQRNNIDVLVFMKILRESSLHTPMFDKKLNNWLKCNYAHPNFPLKHLLKDVELIIGEAAVKNINTAVPKAMKAVLKKSVRQGLSLQDYSVAFKTINNIP